MKNIHTFSTIIAPIAALELALKENSALIFTDCESQDFRKFGFAPTNSVTKLANGYRIDFVFEEKKISTKSINQEVAKRVKQLESKGLEVVKKQRTAIKEEVMVDFCHKALTELTAFSAYYHEKSEKLIIDVSNEKLAGLAVSYLLKLFGSLKTTTLHIDGVSNGLAENLLQSIQRGEDLGFAGFSYADKLNLSHSNNGKAKFNGEYTLDHIAELISDGFGVELVTLRRDGLTFDLTDSFKIKSIKVDSYLTDQVDDEYDDINERDIAQQELELELIIGIIDGLVEFLDKTPKGTERVAA